MRRLLAGLLAVTLVPAAFGQPPDKPPDKVSFALNTDHASPLRGLAFTPDGRKLIAVELQDVHLWDVTAGERERTWRLPDELRKVRVSPDGKTAAVTFWIQNARVSVWLLDLATGGSHVIYPPVFGEEQLAFSPDGRRLALGGDHGAVVWDLKAGHTSHIMRGPAFAESLSFGRDANRLLVSWGHGKGEDNLQCWDVAPARPVPAEVKKPLFTFDGSDHRHAASSPDGARVAGWRRKGDAIEVGVWEADGKRQPTVTVPGFPDPAVLQFAGPDTVVLAAEFQSRVRACVVNLSAGTIDRRLDRPIERKELNPVAVSPDGRLLAASSGPGLQVLLFDLRENRLVRRVGQAGPIPGVVGFGPDGHSIAWGFKQTLWPPSPRDLTAGLNLATLGPLRAGSFDGFRLWRYVPPGLQQKQEEASQRSDGKAGLTIVYQGKRVETEAPGGRTSAYYVTPAGRLGLVVGGGAGGIAHIDGRTGKLLAWFGSRGLMADQLSVSPDGRYLLVARGHQALDLYRIDGKPELLLNVLAVGRDWVVWTPQGYYAATPGGERLIGWKVPHGHDRAADFYPAEQFRKQMYRPDVIRLVLEKGSVAEAVAAADAALVAQRVEVPRGVADPEKLLPPAVALAVVDRANLPRVTVKASARQGCKEQPVRSLRLLVDGRPLPGGLARAEFPAGQEKAEFEATWEVELPPGKHALSVLARTKDDTPGFSPPVEVACQLPEGQRPAAHLIAVGVSRYDRQALNLQYADADARRLADAFAAATGRLYKPGQVRPLLNEQATREAVLRAIDEVRKSAGPGDLFVLSFAGHGAREGGEFFLLTRDADPTNADTLKKTAVSGAELRVKLADFPCQVLLLLDACHSGAVASSRPGTDEAARALSDVDVRAAVMCAALGHEEALEKDGGGLFTAAVVRALKGEPGAFFDHATGELNVYHLQAFVYQEVTRASESRQTPYLKMPLALPAFVVTQLPVGIPGAP
jgi:WD40 repeat protein